VNDTRDIENEPRWLRLAATLRAEADPATLAHVRARLAERSAGPAWVRWLSRPVALAASAALLVVSMFVGGALLSTAGTGAQTQEETSMVSTLLGDDGSYGLPLNRDASAGTPVSDSGGVTP
jgi:hypothetical protein